MASVKFGRKQINNPTPASLNFWVRVITVVVTTVIGWLTTTSDIFSPETLKIIIGVLSLILALCNGLAPLFGVQVEKEEIPVKDVTAVEATKP